jgi:hypothetical protein
MLVTEDLSPGTALDFLEARVEEARSRRSAAVSNSTFHSEGELSNFEEALRQVSRSATWAKIPLESPVNRARILEVTGLIDDLATTGRDASVVDRLAGVAGNPARGEAQLFRRKLALAFSGLEQDWGVSLSFRFNHYQSIEKVVDGLRSPPNARTEAFWRREHPLLKRLDAAYGIWENADRELSKVVIGRDDAAELNVHLRLAEAELRARRYEERVRAKINYLVLSASETEELRRFLVSSTRSEAKIDLLKAHRGDLENPDRFLL